MPSPLRGATSSWRDRAPRRPVTNPPLAVLATHRADPGGLSSASTKVFVLGSLERNITIRSQQVRALNLVSALLDAAVMKPGQKLAIVGAGPAGLTAAVAAASRGLQ